MAEYILKFKNREVSRGDLLTVFADAHSRDAFQAVTPSRKGWVWSRLLVDLKPDFEIRASASE